MESTEELDSSGDMATDNEDTQSLCTDDEDALLEAAGGGGTDNLDVDTCKICDEGADGECQGGLCAGCCESNRGTGPFQCCDGHWVHGEWSSDEPADLVSASPKGSNSMHQFKHVGTPGELSTRLRSCHCPGCFSEAPDATCDQAAEESTVGHGATPQANTAEPTVADNGSGSASCSGTGSGTKRGHGGQCCDCKEDKEPGDLCDAGCCEDCCDGASCWPSHRQDIAAALAEAGPAAAEAAAPTKAAAEAALGENVADSDSDSDDDFDHEKMALWRGGQGASAKQSAIAKVQSKAREEQEEAEEVALAISRVQKDLKRAEEAECCRRIRSLVEAAAEGCGVVLGAGAAAEAEECGHRMLICSAGYSLVKDPSYVPVCPDCGELVFVGSRGFCPTECGCDDYLDRYAPEDGEEGSPNVFCPQCNKLIKRSEICAEGVCAGCCHEMDFCKQCGADDYKEGDNRRKGFCSEGRCPGCCAATKHPGCCVATMMPPQTLAGVPHPTDLELTLMVLSQLQLRRHLWRHPTYRVLAAPTRSIMVPMPLIYHEVCAHRSLVSRALADWSDMCTMSGCECWDDLFAKYGVVGSQQ
jgi:hypothetical protein